MPWCLQRGTFTHMAWTAYTPKIPCLGCPNPSVSHPLASYPHLHALRLPELPLRKEQRNEKAVRVRVCVCAQTYYMQEGALDLQKPVCDQHKNAPHTGCLNCPHTQTHTQKERQREREIRDQALCWTGNKESQVSCWGFDTRTHTRKPPHKALCKWAQSLSQV